MRNMKKRGALLLAVTLGLTLTACGDFNKTAGITPGSTAGDTAREESREAEKLPASQEYVSSDGTYKVILPEGLTQTDVSLMPGAAIMGLDGGSERTGFSCFSIGSLKSNVLGNSGDLESLEDYADYMINMTLDGSGVTVSWEDTDAPSTEGAERCLAREGVARSGASRGQAYGYFVESADSYFSVIMVGNNDDVEEARQIIALEILDGASEQAGTVAFLNGMTAVLDSVNGANIRETFKVLEENSTDKSLLETLESKSRVMLSDSWGIENAADLMEMADLLMDGLHNQDALEFLRKYGGMDVTDRGSFDADLKQQNLDEGVYISLLAAYDAWSAYGEGAIAAWDLSRVGTIMGFGYASGYCTYEEAMDKTLEAAEKAQELFDSWEDFNQSYLYGYSYWAEEALDDPESSAAERAELINSMESQANGPFAMGWDIELKKEW